jgi:predicted MFS family arabinose efflux permease
VRVSDTQSSPAHRDQRARYRDVFADPLFRVVFGSRTLSIGAGTLRMFALSVLVYDTTGSAWLTAITFGIGFVPQVIGGTLLGALADRVAPRPLIVAGFLLECLVALTLGLVALPVLASLALVALVATLAPVFNGASNRLVAQTLTGDAYVLGRSLFSVSGAAAQLVGLAVGALAVAQVGAARALLITAGCQLTAAVWARLGMPALDAPHERAGSAVRRSAEVTARLWRDRAIRGLLLVQWLPPAFVMGVEALLVPYAHQRGFPPGAAGLLLASVPVGMLVGNLVVGRVLRPDTRERMVAPILLVLGIPLIGLALPLPLSVTMGLLFVAGTGFSYGLGVQRAFLDSVEPDLRGQAFALQFTGLMTLQGVGPLVSGGLAEVMPIALVMVACGVGTALVGVVWWVKGRARGAVMSPAPMPLG